MILDSITADIQSSLKSHDSVRVGTLRFLLSAVRNAAITRYGAEWEAKIGDSDVLDVVKKQVKTRKESIEAFTAANRVDLAQKEAAELTILQEFLPKELSDEELTALLLPVAKSGEKNFGLVMKEAMAVVSGRADGKRVSSLLKELM